MLAMMDGMPDDALLCPGTQNSSPPDYSLAADPTDKLWNVFNGLGIMAFAYGNTVRGQGLTR
jgi:hypothetical protein